MIPLSQSGRSPCVLLDQVSRDSDPFLMQAVQSYLARVGSTLELPSDFNGISDKPLDGLLFSEAGTFTGHILFTRRGRCAEVFSLHVENDNSAARSTLIESIIDHLRHDMSVDAIIFTVKDVEIPSSNGVHFFPEEALVLLREKPYIDPAARVHPSAQIGAFTRIAAHAIVSAGAEIGTHCVVGESTLIGERAHIGNNNTIGQFCVFRPDLQMKDRNIIGSYSYIDGCVALGSDNICDVRVNLGALPQDRRSLTPGRVRIGNNNSFFKGCVVSRGTCSVDRCGITTVGNGNFFCQDCHIAHDVCVGDDNTLINGATLGGHVRVGSRNWIGAGVKVSPLSIISDGVNILGDTNVTGAVPPWCAVHKGAHGLGRIARANSPGLKYWNVAEEVCCEIDTLYRIARNQGIGQAREWYDAQSGKSVAAKLALEFLEEHQKGALLMPFYKRRSSEDSLDG